MKVTAFIGSGRKRHTYNASEKFLQNLQSLGNIEYEIVRLSDYNLGTCKDCKLCLDKGEELCPFKDDRDILIEKMKNSDGIFASPNYSFQVSALMKIFLDRLAFNFHRRCFFGKTFTSIVVQGIAKGEEIVKYLDFIGKGMSFNVVKGCCLKSLEPMTEKSQKEIDRIILPHLLTKNLVIMKKRKYDIVSNQIVDQPGWQRITLLSVIGYETVGALSGGFLLALSPDGRLMDMPVEIMHGFFKDFLLPGLMLIGLGILNAAAFIAVLFKNRTGWFLSGLALGGLVIWFTVEILILQEIHWLHAMWGLPVIIGCLMIIPLIPRSH